MFRLFGVSVLTLQSSFNSFPCAFVLTVAVLLQSFMTVCEFSTFKDYPVLFYAALIEVSFTAFDPRRETLQENSAKLFNCVVNSANDYQYLP